MLSIKYRRWTDEMIASTPEMESLLNNIDEVRREIKRLQDVEKDMQQMLYNMVGEHEMIVDPHTGLDLAHWKYTKDSVILDTVRLKEEQKDLYNAYLKPKKGHRVLRIVK